MLRSSFVLAAVAAGLGLTGTAQAQGAPPCPPADFTVVSVDQERPGGPATATLDVPGPGWVSIKTDDGLQGNYGESASAAGRLAVPLPVSDRTGRRFTGGTQDEAGEAVTVGYTLTYAMQGSTSCTRPDGTLASGGESTRTFAYTFKPNPLKTVRLTFSTTSSGQAVIRMACTNIPSDVCSEHAVDVRLTVPNYRRYVKHLPSSSLLSGLVRPGLGMRFDRGTLRGLKRLPRVEAVLAIRLNGVRGSRDGLRRPAAEKRKVTLRRGVLAPQTFTMSNAAQGLEEDSQPGRGGGRG
jgi:hypothetical protein